MLQCRTECDCWLIVSEVGGFSQRLAKLTVLGKFLGFLLFRPLWDTPHYMVEDYVSYVQYGVIWCFLILRSVWRMLWSYPST